MRLWHSRCSEAVASSHRFQPMRSPLVDDILEANETWLSDWRGGAELELERFDALGRCAPHLAEA